MEITEEIFSKLVIDNIVNSAIIKALLNSISAYIDVSNNLKDDTKINLPAAKKVFKEKLDFLIWEELKTWGIADELTDYYADKALERFREMLEY